MSWRVMMNHKLWNQDKYEQEFYVSPERRRIAQSKGRCKMVVCPKKGDSVVFVLKGKIVMKGVVDSDGFVTGTDHQTDSCNSDDGVRSHAEICDFAWIMITEVGLSQEIRKTGQRTWVSM